MGAIASLRGMATACLVLACDGPPGSPVTRAVHVPAEAGTSPETTSDAKRDTTLYTHSARRCSECHESYYEQWSHSAHAQASISAAYVHMRAETNAQTCDRCHSPLTQELGGQDERTREGVGCDVCHGIARVESGELAQRWSLELETQLRYGPLCDAKDHYFHRMGCAPIQQTSELCAACHKLDWSSAKGTVLPVLSEYREWKASPYAAQDMQCQYCHMPDERAEVAKGAGLRDEVSHHGFLARASDLRRNALGMEVRMQATSDKNVKIGVDMINRAGHGLPSGFPGRQVVLSVRLEPVDGPPLLLGEKVYTRTLVDLENREVPFHRAERLAADNRLQVREKRSEVFEFEIDAAGLLVIEARWRSLSDDLASQLATVVTQEVLASSSIRLGPPRRRRQVVPIRSTKQQRSTGDLK